MFTTKAVIRRMAATKRFQVPFGFSDGPQAADDHQLLPPEVAPVRELISEDAMVMAINNLVGLSTDERKKADTRRFFNFKLRN